MLLLLLVGAAGEGYVPPEAPGRVLPYKQAPKRLHRVVHPQPEVVPEIEDEDWITVI